MEAVLTKEIVVSKACCRIFGVLTFVILTGLGAFVRIPLPFTPVPITLQTFFVLLSGAFLGSRLGALSQLSYISLGILGLPIFSGAGSGFSYLLGPTGGYLLGFVLATLFIGRFLKTHQHSLVAVFGLFLLGDLILFCPGIIWLGVIFGYNFRKLLFIGFMPFVLGDLLKIWLATILYFKLKSRIQGIF